MRTALIVLVVACLWNVGLHARPAVPPVPTAADDAAPLATVEKATETEKEDERLICRREKPIGSNRATRVCRTQAQIREESRSAQDGLMRNSNPSLRAGN